MDIRLATPAMVTALEVNPAAETVGRVVTKGLLESSVAAKAADLAEKSGRQASSAATNVTGQGGTAYRTKTLVLVTAKTAHHVTEKDRRISSVVLTTEDPTVTHGRLASFNVVKAVADLAKKSGNRSSFAGTNVADRGETVSRRRTLSQLTAKTAHRATATNRLEGLAAVKAADDARTPGQPGGPMAAAAASIAVNGGRLENLELVKAETIVAANVHLENLAAVTAKTVGGIGRAVAGQASVKGRAVIAVTANAMGAARTATERMPVLNSASRHCQKG